MRSTDDKPIFANVVVGQGIHNNNVNIQLGCFYFSPSADGKSVDPDPVIVARLRMDIPCARQLRDSLDGLLQVHDAAVEAVGKTNGAAPAPEAAAEPEKALN